jgi:hypothetical protein
MIGIIMKNAFKRVMFDSKQSYFVTEWNWTDYWFRSYSEYLKKNNISNYWDIENIYGNINIS